MKVKKQIVLNKSDLDLLERIVRDNVESLRRAGRRVPESHKKILKNLQDTQKRV